MKSFISLIILFLVSVFTSGLRAEESYYLQMTDSALYYIGIADWVNAERSLKEALRAEPANVGNALLLNNLARVQQQSGRFHEALENFNIALSITPANSTIRFNRGALLFAFGKYEEAVEDISFAIDAGNDSPSPLLMRGLAYMKLGKNEESEKDLRKSLAVDAGYTEAMEALAGLLIARGDRHEGIEWLEKIVKLHPDAPGHFRLAYAQAIDGDLRNAAENVRIGLSIDPLYGNLYLLRAYLNQQRYDNEAKDIDIRLGKERGGDMNLFRNLLK